MMKRSFVMFSALMLLFTAISLPAQDIDELVWKKAREIHRDAIVIDAHAHPMTTQGMVSDAVPANLDLSRKTKYSVVDFVTMKEGGLDAAFYSVPFLNNLGRENTSKRIMDAVVLLRSHIDKHSDLAEIALSPTDVRRIHDLGKRAVLFGIESGGCMEGHPVMLEAYYKMGVRLITLAHTKIDPIADTDRDEAGDSGLSRFGRHVVKKMNRLGMLIDITHVPDNLQLSIIKESRGPVLASHSCVRALNNRPREMPDEIITELAKKGGAIMITFGSAHLSYDYAEKNSDAYGRFHAEKSKLEERFKDDSAELEKRIESLKGRIFGEGVAVDLLIDHIDHAVEVAGIDHVGLGSDFIAGIGGPMGLETAAGFPLITYHLLKRGYEAESIKKILGENLLRIFSKVGDISSKLK